MKSILAILLLAWIAPTFVHSAVLGSRGDKEDKETYEHETAAFKQQGLCRLYRGQGVDPNKSYETCYDFCHKAQGDNSDIGCQAATEASGKTQDVIDPDGHIFSMGQCLCEAPAIAKELAEIVIEALPAVAAIGCEILFNTFDKVLELGTLAIPGVGELSAGMSSSIKAAKTIAENGETASGFAQWFGDPCNPDHSPDIAKYTNQIDKIFDPLSAVSDDIQTGAGCVIPDKKKCKSGKGGKGPDTTSKSPDSTTTRPEDKTTSTNDPSSTKSDDKTTTTSWMPCDTTAADICKVDPNVCKDPDSTPDLSVSPGDGSSDSDTGEEPSEEPELDSRDLEERGSQREPLYISFSSQPQPFKIESLPYPPQGKLFETNRGAQVIQNAFDFSSQDLKDLKFDSKKLPSANQRKNDEKWVTEHIVELQTIRDFIRTAVTGTLNSNKKANTPKIPEKFFIDNWNKPTIPKVEAQPNVGKANRKSGSRVPNSRIFEALGSNFNRADFVLCIKGINGIKALLWDNKDSKDLGDFKKAVDRAADPDEYDSTKSNKGKGNGSLNKPDDDSKQLVSVFMTSLRNTIGVFRYLQDHDVNTRLWEIVDNVHKEMSLIENALSASAGGQGLTAMWDEFIKDQLDRVETKGKSWLGDSIKYAKAQFNDAKKKIKQGQKTPQYIDFTLTTLEGYEGEISKCTIPRMTMGRR